MNQISGYDSGFAGAYGETCFPQFYSPASHISKQAFQHWLMEHLDWHCQIAPC
jgi:hypothetical protein